jgi:hypothetical protein
MTDAGRKTEYVMPFMLLTQVSIEENSENMPEELKSFATENAVKFTWCKFKNASFTTFKYT